MSEHSHQEPNGESTIPMWVYVTSLGLMVFTVLCFVVMVLGMLYE